MAASNWFDPGSASVKTVQALGLVALILALVVGLVLLVLGGVRCREAWVRRTVNRRAVVSLVLVLAGWLLVYVGGGLAFTVYRPAVWPLIGVAVLLFCSGIGLGLSGLGQIRRHPKWFNYGRGHAEAAVWGGVVPLAVVLFLAGGLSWVYRGDFGMLRLLARGFYESETFGYRVKLAGGLWKRWPEIGGRVEGSEFAVLGMMEDKGLFVLPVWLAGRREVDMGAMAEALLAEVGHKPGEPKMETVAPPGGGVADERHFAIFVPREKGGIAYRYRVAAHGGVAYLIGAWIDQRQGASQERLDEEVMRVSLGGAGVPKAAGPVGQADSVALHARLFRRMAGYLSRHGMAADAGAWASEAQKLDGGAGQVEEIAGSGEAVARAIFALDVGAGQRALDLAGGILRGEPTNHVALAVKGLALAEMGKLSEGLKVVETGLKATGQSPTLAAAADFLRARMDNDAGGVLGVALDPVEVPEALFEVADPSEEAKAVGAGYDWAVTALRFRRGEPLVVSRYGRVRILSESGLGAFQGISEPFDPRVELPHISRGIVRDDKGGEVRQIALGAWRVAGADGEGAARLFAEVPGLKVGQAVEWVVTFRRGAPTVRVPFWAHCFSMTLPARRSVLWVEGDFRSVAASSSGGVPRPAGQPRPHWIVEDPPAKPPGEQYLPPDEVYLPHVWFGETERKWQQLAVEYLGFLGDALAPDEVLREAAARAVSGTEGADGKVAALARFVHGELRASRERFGAGDRLPGRPRDVLSSREGDSRGHAALLNSLLRAEGIESSLALVCAGGLFHDGIPSLEHFNRMLVFVPGLQQQFVDCYRKDGDPIGAVPAEVAARRALVLDPKEPRLLDVPPSPAVAAIGLIRKVRHTGGGEFEIEEEAQIKGAVPVILAERIGWGVGSTAFGKAFIAEAKGVDVRGIDVDGGAQKGPVRVKISAVWRSRGGGDMRIPALLETLILDPGPVAGRRGPAWLGSAVAIRGQLEVMDGSSAVKIPVPDVQLVGRRLVGCAFEGKGGFIYAVERIPGLLTAENFKRMSSEVREVLDAIEPRAALAGAAGR